MPVLGGGEAVTLVRSDVNEPSQWLLRGSLVLGMNSSLKLLGVW